MDSGNNTNNTIFPNNVYLKYSYILVFYMVPKPLFLNNVYLKYSYQTPATSILVHLPNIL